jgi:hypothetical protein
VAPREPYAQTAYGPVTWPYVDSAGSTGTRRIDDTVVVSELEDGEACVGVAGGCGTAVRGDTGIVGAGEACAVSACTRVAGALAGAGTDAVGWALTNELAGA